MKITVSVRNRSVGCFPSLNIVTFFLALALPLWVPSATAEEQAYLGNYGIIMVNNQPFFPIGLYHDSMDAGRYGKPLIDDLNTIAGSGDFNTMIVSLDPTFGQPVKDFYLAAAQKNIKVISQVYLPALSLEVSAYKGMPQLFGIGIGDDINSPPSKPKYPPATMLSRHKTVKSINPHFLTYGAAGGHKVYPIAPYARTMDIIGVECYPFGDGSQSYANELEATDDYFYYNRMMTDTYITDIAILQGFSWNGSRWPTAVEARNQPWIATIRGVQGVVWYSYYHNPGVFITQNSALWNEIRALSTDLKNFAPVVLNAFNTRKEQHYAGDNAFVDDSGGWHAASWQYNEATYVVIGNTHRTQSQSVTVNLPSGTTGKVQPMFSTSRYGSGFSRSGTQLSGMVAPAAVHVYQIGCIPSPWQSKDLGSVGAAGTASAASGRWTVQGAGSDIGGTADNFQLVYKTLNGNGTVIAKVESVQNINSSAKAGVTIRESLTSNSKNAFMAITPGAGAVFQRRTSTEGTTSSTTKSAKVPYWVKLVRQGNTFTGSISSNGSSWTQVDSTTISMATSVSVGLAVSSYNSGALCEAVFSSVSAQ